METFNILRIKFWRNVGHNTAAVRDIVSDLDSVKKFVDTMDYVSNPIPQTDQETDEDEDSFFELVLTGPNKYSNASLKQGNSEVNLPYKPKSFPVEPHSPKLRVCFLSFRKSKFEKSGTNNYSNTNPEHQKKKQSPNKQSKRKEESSSSKQFARTDMPKYLKLMKPLYSRASKRYTDKIRVSDTLHSPSVQSLTSPRISSDEKHGNRAAVLGAVRKRLGKSRSMASSFAGVSSSPMNRRDDSLLEQNDGIQGAILHCKRCYSSSSKDLKSASEDLPRASSEELNRWSI